MDDVQGLGQLHQLGEVGEGAGPAAALEIVGIGRSADRAEVHVIAAHDDVAGGIAGMERELRRHGGQRLLDEPALELHDLAGLVDVGARLLAGSGAPPGAAPSCRFLSGS